MDDEKRKRALFDGTIPYETLNLSLLVIFHFPFACVDQRLVHLTIPAMIAFFFFLERIHIGQGLSLQQASGIWWTYTVYMIIL
jgi:hypothetical protein